MEYEKKCEWCGKVFIAKRKDGMYCSNGCNQKALYAKRKRTENVKKTCAFCGEKFEAVNKRRKYCSDTCNARAYKARLIESGAKEPAAKKRTPRKKVNTCMICGKDFEALSANKVYCSEECSAKAIEGKHCKKRRQNNKKAILSIAKKAREEHLTYGQYVAKYGL